MALNEFGIKELYSVKLKATYPIEIGNKSIEEGETICYFDSVQISGFDEMKSYVSAHGGLHDVSHVWWETTKQLKFFLERGIFSQTHFALLSNSRIFPVEKEHEIAVSAREEVESDENGEFEVRNIPSSNFFVYELETGKKITDYEKIDEKRYRINQQYCNLIVDYTYQYMNGGSILTIGPRLVRGFLSLEGRTRVKDDVTGHTHTGILVIPKVKLMSDLSMRLGENANPVVGRTEAIAIPDESSDHRVMELYFLNDDIDSDM